MRLLDRTKQHVSLTEEGRSFFVDAKRVLALSTEIVDSVQRLSRHETPTLSIGYVANLFYDLLPATLSAFQRALPTVSVNLFDMNCGDQFRACTTGKLGLGASASAIRWRPPVSTIVPSPPTRRSPL